MSDWQPIDTAPRDGTVVDLWMVGHPAKGYRQVDAYFVWDREARKLVWRGDAYRFDPPVMRDGWWAPGCGDDGEDWWCDMHPWYADDREWLAPSHWRPVPAPPPAEEIAAFVTAQEATP